MRFEMKKLCPCQSSENFSDCCEPIISGKKTAETAEALMRSRYSAYTFNNVHYLLKTWHHSTRPEFKDFDSENITKWISLVVKKVEGGERSDIRGKVEFIAAAKAMGSITTLHEISNFIKEDGLWFYVDGDILEPDGGGNNKNNTKVGRNAPCPCGSGKKFKKCCYK
jgi:SEC-C motif domain protein